MLLVRLTAFSKLFHQLTSFMSRYRDFIILSILIVLAKTNFAQAQSSLTLSAPLIHSKIEVADNWSPATAVGGRKHLNGTTTGYGINLNYSFRPAFLIKNPRISLDVGVGYFAQRFDLRRPFDYISPLEPIFYTDHYIYHCWQWSTGLTYKQPLNKKYFLSSNLSYTWLHSFRQEYTPVSNHGYGDMIQTAERPIGFGNIFMLGVGINRNVGEKLAFGFNVLVPLYVRWRNDSIFKDDPTKFYRPGFGLGLNASLTYRLKKNANPQTSKP
mgnify:CR=1 FL=1